GGFSCLPAPLVLIGVFDALSQCRGGRRFGAENPDLAVLPPGYEPAPLGPSSPASGYRPGACPASINLSSCIRWAESPTRMAPIAPSSHATRATPMPSTASA